LPVQRTAGARATRYPADLPRRSRASSTRCTPHARDATRARVAFLCPAKGRTDRRHGAGDVLFDLPHCGWPVQRPHKRSGGAPGARRDDRRPCGRKPPRTAPAIAFVTDFVAPKLNPRIEPTNYTL